MVAFSSGRSLTLGSFEAALANRGPYCDLSDLTFIDAYGIVGTACALLSSGSLAQLPDLQLPDLDGPRQHLDSMGLTGVLKQAGYPFGHDPITIDKPDVLVPLTAMTGIHAAEQLSHLLVEQIGDIAAVEVIEPLTEGLWELAANALEHSGQHALLMGQVYADGHAPHHDGWVQVVVGDIGKGIRRSFLDSGTQSPQSDMAAIRLALEYLVSSVPDRGRGQGLTTTAEGVTRWGGTLVVRSGQARIDVTRAGQRARVVSDLPGTLVAITLPLYPLPGR
jgi:anti-sigma regulatory factor (Ser/Thr protein kinase)